MKYYTLLFVLAIVLAGCGENASSDATPVKAPKSSLSETKKSVSGNVSGDPKEEAEKKAEESKPLETEATLNAKSALSEILSSETRVFSTFGSGMEDEQVSSQNLQPWVDVTSNYEGTYQAAFGSTISQITVKKRGGTFSLAVAYQTEKISEDGLMEPVTGLQPISGAVVKGTVVRWNRVPNVAETQGQFVRWTDKAGQSYRGFLAYDGIGNFRLLKRK